MILIIGFSVISLNFVREASVSHYFRLVWALAANMNLSVLFFHNTK
jgi:hypothetical protein